MVDVATIILAGGLSSRMGQDKALLKVNQETLLQHVYSVAEACTDLVYVVTPWIERYAPVMPAKCQFIRETALPDGVGVHGPLVGFAQGLGHVQTDWVLLLACDLPRLQADVLQQGQMQLQHVPEEAIAFLPKHPRGWEPLCGFYRRRCLPELQEFIASGGRSFQRWLAQQYVEEFQLSDTSILFNCNSPTDLAALESGQDQV